MSTCKWCGAATLETELHAPVTHAEMHEMDCELTELRKLRDRLIEWDKSAFMRSALEIDSIVARAKDLSK